MQTLKKLVVTQKEIRDKVEELGRQINRDYRDRDLVMVGILNGAFMFLADLCREIELPMEIDFIRVASYGNRTSSTGEVRFTKDLEISVTGKDVLIVEDIVDTGGTIARLLEFFQEKNPRSVRTCALIDKQERREVDIMVDYPGFAVPGGFLVGYGLDYAEKHRQYPEIYHLQNVPEDV